MFCFFFFALLCFVLFCFGLRILFGIGFSGFAFLVLFGFGLNCLGLFWFALPSVRLCLLVALLSCFGFALLACFACLACLPACVLAVCCSNAFHRSWRPE